MKNMLCYTLILLGATLISARVPNFVNHHRAHPMGCTCEDKSQCGPIPPAKGRTRLAYTTNPDDWKYYNLTKLTEMAVFFDVSKLQPEMVCLAHKNNVQLHLQGAFTKETFLDPYKQEKWIVDHFKMITDNNLDGINVDYETARDPAWETHLVDFMLELTVRLKDMNPNYQLTYCEPWGPWSYYDFGSIPTFVDYLMLMSYDEEYTHKPGYIYPTANQRPSVTMNGIVDFIAAGVPPSKLVVGMPWYGYLFDCKNITSDGKCVVAKVDGQSTFPMIHEEFVAKGGYDFANGWDDESLTPFLTITSKDKSVMKQLWCDNGTSLMSKSEIYKQFDIRGVAAFQLENIDYTDPELEGLIKPFWEMFSLFED